jgi:hypothetical protein
MKIVKLTKKFFVHYETVKFYYRVPSKHRWSLSWAIWNQSAPLRIPLRSTTMWPALSSDIYYNISINEGLQTQILINLPIPCTIQHLLFTCQLTLTTPRIMPIHLWSLTITIFTVGFQDDKVTTMLTILRNLLWSSALQHWTLSCCNSLTVNSTVTIKISPTDQPDRNASTLQPSKVQLNNVLIEYFLTTSQHPLVPSWSCSKAVNKPVRHIPLLSVQWINSWWWTDELSENM